MTPKDLFNKFPILIPITGILLWVLLPITLPLLLVIYHKEEVRTFVVNYFTEIKPSNIIYAYKQAKESKSK